MSESQGVVHRVYRDALVSAVSVGAFFIILGAIFITTPNLFDNVLSFFRDFDLVHVPNTEIPFPAPTSPWTHTVVYSAVTQFCFAWGLFQVFVLALRFVVRSLWGKKAETASDIVFWLGAGYLASSFLNGATTMVIWFAFWAQIVMLIGVSLVIRAIILASRM